MADRITQTHERILTTTVNDIVTCRIAIVEWNFGSENLLSAERQYPDRNSPDGGRFPNRATLNAPMAPPRPLIIKYTASSVPVIQIGMSSKEVPEQDLFDLAVNTLRPPVSDDTGCRYSFSLRRKSAFGIGGPRYAGHSSQRYDSG